MKDFLIKNWYYIFLAVLAALSFTVSFIVSVKKKGKLNLLDSIKESILENIPFWAILSENLVSGEDKKNNVISLGIALAAKMSGKKLSEEETSYFVAFISEQLEKVLSAPQKKLVKAENPQKSKYRIGG